MSDDSAPGEGPEKERDEAARDAGATGRAREGGGAGGEATDTGRRPGKAAEPTGTEHAEVSSPAVPSASAASSDEPASSDAGPSPTGRERLIRGLWPPRVNRNQLTVALLLFVLGLGLAIQVRSTNENSPLSGARREDLVRILDELDSRTERLEEEKRKLENQRSELENSSNQAEEARRQTQERARQLGVLAGTVAAEGPGIRMTVSDTMGTVEAHMLLDTIQELRAAGAEAIEVNGVRVVTNTHFTDDDGDIRIDGRKVSAPYRFEVIGEPQDLEPALNIPGGVVQTLEKEQATVSITRSEKIVVDALRSEKRPDYARSSSQ